MLNNWKIEKLGNLAEKLGSGITPRGGRKVYIDSGVPLIRSQNVYNTHFSFNGLTFLAYKNLKGLENVIIEKNDNLINITGDSVARTNIVPESLIDARVNQHVMIIRSKKELLNYKYLHYFLILPYTQKLLLSYADSGGTRKALTKEMMSELKIPCPPLPTQERIADILGSLDDKIELNRQMNTTLEAMARAIFKSWFVNFDPVYAKMEGRDYSLPAEVMDLFPDELVESELGLIPQGWEVGNLCDIAKQEKDGINPFEFPDTIFKHYSIPAFDSGQYPLFEMGETIKSRKYIVVKDSILLSKLNPDTPRIWMSNNPDNVSICSTEFLVFTAKKGYSKTYLYSLFKTRQFSKKLASYVTGTSKSHQRVKPNDVLGLTIIKAPELIISTYIKFVSPFLDKVNKNIIESQTLSKLRDTLLPRLMSGEIEV